MCDDRSDQPPAEALNALHVDDRIPATLSEENAASSDKLEQGDGEIAERRPIDGPPSQEATKAPSEPDWSVVRLIEKANGSAGKLVNLLAKHFPSFRDETRFDGRKVRLMKRAQIFVADLWAAMNGKGYGAFDDIDHLTMFAGEFPQTLAILFASPWQS